MPFVCDPSPMGYLSNCEPRLIKTLCLALQTGWVWNNPAAITLGFSVSEPRAAACLLDYILPLNPTPPHHINPLTELYLGFLFSTKTLPGTLTLVGGGTGTPLPLPITVISIHSTLASKLLYISLGAMLLLLLVCPSCYMILRCNGSASSGVFRNCW